MNIYDILACPTCKIAVTRYEQTLHCSQCQRSYPIINNVPVLFPDGSVPSIQHEADLSIRTGYNPWIERLVIQSLPANAIILDLGAGNMAFSLPNVIRMDVTLTPYVDIVCDAHALPFLPGSFDFIFSLAVIEHLRQPFVAAQEMYQALRDGGYVYGECNFVYPYHGYPHHYFNASQQGITETFKQFHCLRASVAPYQMPSFAVRFVLESYDHYLGLSKNPEIQPFQQLLRDVLAFPLGQYDAHFTEETALRLAAGVFFFGVKSEGGSSDVIPAALLAHWRESSELQQRFPVPLDLGRAANLMLWAKAEGLATTLAHPQPFEKTSGEWDATRKAFDALPVPVADFGHIPDVGTIKPSTLRVKQLEEQIELKNQHIRQLESLLGRIETGRIMRILQWLQGRRRN